MKRVFAWVAATIMLISSSFNVMASNEVSVSDGDLVTAAATTKDVEVDVEKGSTFTVSVPIIPPINEEVYKIMEKSDGFFSDCTVTGDIASNEQVVVSVDEDVVFSPDGGLKDSVTWKAHTIPSASTEQDLNATNIVDGEIKTIGVKLSKGVSAGLWKGYLHVNVSIEPYGSVLTAEQFKTLIGDYDGEVNISIPKYVEIDGVQTLVRGIGEGALSGYPNLASINLETDEEFYFEDSFKGLSTSADTVVINGNSNVVKVSDVSHLTTKITFSNCTLYVNGNPYVDSVSDMIDMSTVQYVRDVHGSFTELSLNERSLLIDTDCMANASVDKLVIPEFVFNCVKSAAFRGSGVKEVEVSNDVVGDSWFEDCKDLTKVTLKDGVTTIGDNAFSGCTNLTDVEVPETVTAIGAGAFDGTPFLDKVKNNGDGTINGIPITEVKRKSELVYSEDGKTLLKIPTDFEGVAEIKDGVTKIASGAVEDSTYDKVTLVKIPATVTSIDDDTLDRLNNSFAIPGRIQLDKSNQNFFSFSGVKLYTQDDQIGISDIDGVSLITPAVYYQDIMRGNDKSMARGETGYIVQDGRVWMYEGCPTQMVFEPLFFNDPNGATCTDIDVTFKDFTGSVSVIAVDSDYSVTDVSIFDVTTTAWEQVTEMYGGGTYRIEITGNKDTFLLFTYTVDSSTVRSLGEMIECVQFSPVYNEEHTVLETIPCEYQGAIYVPDTCVTVDGNIDYYKFVDNVAYRGITDLVLSASVSDIQPTVLEHLNNMFGEDEKVHVAKGNTTFTVMSGTNGTNVDRQVIKASDEYKPIQKMSWMDCDGVVYAHTDYQTVYDLAIKPVYFAEGSYIITQTNANISEFSVAATTSSGSRYVLNGASEDDDLLHSSGGTINLTIPSGGLFIWTNITAKQNASNPVDIASIMFNRQFTVTKK